MKKIVQNFKKRIIRKMEKREARVAGLISLIILAGLLLNEFLTGNMQELQALKFIDYTDTNSVMSYTRWIIYVMMAISTVYLLLNAKKMNNLIAVFGHTAVEEVVLSKVILKIPTLSFFVWSVFLITGGIALYLAYSNTFKQKKIGIPEMIFNLVTSLIIVLAPVYL